jgi:hypothetical protein
MMLRIAQFIAPHVKQLAIIANSVLLVRKNVPVAQSTVSGLYPATERTFEFFWGGAFGLFCMDADES